VFVEEAAAQAASDDANARNRATRVFSVFAEEAAASAADEATARRTNGVSPPATTLGVSTRPVGSVTVDALAPPVDGPTSLRRV
jgi:hypothetical protein